MNLIRNEPGDYVHFKAHVPLRHISVGTKQWRYYDYGPKEVAPLICLSGMIGTADVFYKQVMFLSTKGYRVIAADAPSVWSHQEWVNSFEKFLDTIDVHHVHLYGTELGGFLAQLFAQQRPRRVKSLVLSNTFLDTRYFVDRAPWSSLINWTPSFMLKRYILTRIPDGPQEPFIADSVDFVVSQLETLSREGLASRLILKTTFASIGRLLLPDSTITIMDTNDCRSIPQQLKTQLLERYPSARGAFLKTGGDFPFLSRPDEVNLHLQTNDCRSIPQQLKTQLLERYPSAKGAFLKTGGDFPFLSRPDEVNLHLQLHLRRVGIEGRPDLIKGPSRRDSTGNPTGKKDHLEDHGDTSKTGESSFSQLEDASPADSSVDSAYDIDKQLGSSASIIVECQMLIAEEFLAVHIFQLAVQCWMGFHLRQIALYGTFVMIAIVLMDSLSHLLSISLTSCLWSILSV